MATETLTVYLGDEDDEIKGSDHIGSGRDKDDNQIVTILDDSEGSKTFDGGNLTFEFWGKGSPTTPGAGPGGDDVFKIDLSGFDDNFDIDLKSMDAGDTFQITGWDTKTVVGTFYTFTYTGDDGGSYTMTIDAQSENGDTGVDVVRIVCFVRGTRIRTENGDIAIEDLSIGDEVLCGDGELHPIRWIGGRRLNTEMLKANPHLRPVVLERDALGAARPDDALALSPQHRVMLSDWRAELLFGAPEVLVAAKMLINDTTVRKCLGYEEVEYFHILLDSHRVVYANGLECETLMPAELAKHAMSAEQRSELFEIFPELAADLTLYGDLRHRALKGYEVSALFSYKA